MCYRIALNVTPGMPSFPCDLLFSRWVTARCISLSVYSSVAHFVICGRFLVLL